MFQINPQSQADLKYHNLKLIFDLVKQEGPLSRAALAKRTGLSATSLTRIVNKLLGLGVIAEHTVASVGTAGRPGILLGICPGAVCCLCIDAMPNFSRVTLVNMASSIIAYRELPMPAGITFQETTQALSRVLEELCRDAGVLREQVLCCGMSVSGHVLDGRHITASSQLNWRGVDGADILEEALGMPAFVENDCKAALMGEQRLLALDGALTENIAYLKLGWTGVGSAAIVDGRLLRGSRNAAGEIGYFNAQPEGLSDRPCEYPGSFDRIISESGVLKRAEEINPAYNSLSAINQGLLEKDPRLQSLLEEIAEYIAIAIVDISCAYNPDTVVLGGNLISGCTGCYPLVMQFLDKRLKSSIHPNLRVQLSKMGSNASLYGMSCISVEQAVQQLLRRPETIL